MLMVMTTMSTTYLNCMPAIPDEDGSLFLAAVRPTTGAAKTFVGILKRHLAARDLENLYEFYIISGGDDSGEGPAAVWLRSRVRD